MLRLRHDLLRSVHKSHVKGINALEVIHAIDLNRFVSNKSLEFRICRTILLFFTVINYLV